MSGTAYFVFGIHNHQPVGNFPEVFERAYRMSYLPFLEVMERHPGVRWSLHASGILWDFFVKEHPEYIARVKAQVAAGRLELLTGGHYEPIMPVIPDEDRVGQIRRLSSFLSSTFGVAPRGMWLAERVWEPGLVRSLSAAGVGFTVVDDAHFTCAGMEAEALRGYYATQDRGTKLDIFPISQRLRYTIPFQPVEATIDLFRTIAAEGASAPVLVMADDGEKFGLWPETYKHVYEDGWLDRFLTALDQNADWLKTITFSECLDRFRPTGTVYLPTASYFEMSEWTLPADAQEAFECVVKRFEHEPTVKRFLRGGFWRNFLTKYAESNTVYQRMLGVSARLRSLRADEHALAPAREALYAGQCNCAYWHGVFGGLYLPHLRTALYRELLTAHAALDALDPPAGAFRQDDADADGQAELLYADRTQALFLAPHVGGTLYEWDILAHRVNLLNVLTRRREAYHARLREFLAHPPQGDGGVKTIHDMVTVKEQNLDRYLVYDWHRRSSLVDHFVHPATTREGFRRAQYGEQGDFVLAEYAVSLNGARATLSRCGTVWDGDHACRVRIEKTIAPGADGLSVGYRLVNEGDVAARLTFVPELCFAFSSCAEEDDSELTDMRTWQRRDPHFGLTVRMDWSVPADVWTFPLETVSLSESGFERTYQGMVMAPVFRLELGPGASRAIDLRIRIS